VTLPRLELVSTSRASDAGFLASADLSAVAKEMRADYRLVGGLAVTLLVAVHGATGLAPGRETADADFGAAPEVLAHPALLEGLRQRGYSRSGGNRFLRE
jgi:hypothetical protein